jgi:hypothetical protein
MTDTFNDLSDIKVTGVDSMPMFFSKDAFSDLASSAPRYFQNMGQLTPAMEFALLHLRYLGHEDFLYRHLEDSPRHVDSHPPLTVKPSE